MFTTVFLFTFTSAAALLTLVCDEKSKIKCDVTCMSAPSAQYFNYYVNFFCTMKMEANGESEVLALDIIQLEATQNTILLCKKTRRRCDKLRLGL